MRLQHNKFYFTIEVYFSRTESETNGNMNKPKILQRHENGIIAVSEWLKTADKSAIKDPSPQLPTEFNRLITG